MICFKYKKAVICIAVAFLLLSLLSIPIYALTPGEILKTAIERRGMQNFSGISRTLSFIKSKEFETQARVSFRRPGMCRMERMRGTLPERFVITKDDEILTIDPRRRQVFRTKIVTSPDKRNEKENLLLKNYSGSFKGEESIAGRNSYIIEVSSELKGRPRKVLWIDRKTFAILSSKTFTPGGNLKISVLFSEVNFNDVPSEEDFNIPAEFETVDIRQNDRQVNSLKELSEKVGFEAKLPEKLPEGFVFDGFFTYHCNCGIEMAHIRYFDGLAGISVFEGPKNCPKCGEGFSWRRAIGMKERRRCATGECELTEQKWESARTFFDDERRFVIVSDIASGEVDIIEKALREK